MVGESLCWLHVAPVQANKSVATEPRRSCGTE